MTQPSSPELFPPYSSVSRPSAAIPAPTLNHSSQKVNYMEFDQAFTAGRSSLGTWQGEQSNEPYATLIYRALMSTPGHRMVLKEIYEWFERNTDKAKDPKSRGWQNSIRHNLSMNGVSNPNSWVRVELTNDRHFERKSSLRRRRTVRGTMSGSSSRLLSMLALLSPPRDTEGQAPIKNSRGLTLPFPNILLNLGASTIPRPVRSALGEYMVITSTESHGIETIWAPMIVRRSSLKDKRTHACHHMPQ